MARSWQRDYDREALSIVEGVGEHSSAVTAILAATLVLPVVALAEQHGPEQLNHGGTGFPKMAGRRQPTSCG